MIDANRYRLPEHISQHVDYVTPGIALSSLLEKKSVSKRWEPPNPEHPHPHWHSGHHPWPHHEPYNGPSGTKSLPPELQNCGKKITPDCLRALYGIPSAEEVAKTYDSDPINSVGVFEQSSVYIPKDLDRFFKKYTPNVPVGTRPKLDSIEHPTVEENRTTRVLAEEAIIDLDILYSLTYPQTVTYAKIYFTNTCDDSLTRL